MSSLRVIPRSALHCRTYDERPKRVNDHNAESSWPRPSLNPYAREFSESQQSGQESQVELECCC
jgi:hypothetical protein